MFLYTYKDFPVGRAKNHPLLKLSLPRETGRLNNYSSSSTTIAVRQANPRSRPQTMSTPATIKRPPLIHRPWITGKYYDDYTRASILHCDAWIMAQGALKYLAIDWLEAGSKRIAQDGWLIEPDGLTPIWDAWRAFDGVPIMWTARNHAEMTRLHATVMRTVETMQPLGPWSRVVVQAHYIDVRERDTEISANGWKPPKAYARPAGAPLPDIL